MLIFCGWYDLWWIQSMSDRGLWLLQHSISDSTNQYADKAESMTMQRQRIKSHISPQIGKWNSHDECQSILILYMIASLRFWNMSIKNASSTITFRQQFANYLRSVYSTGSGILAGGTNLPESCSLLYLSLL